MQSLRMPRTSVAIVANHCYRVINRGNNQLQRFPDRTDYAAFLWLVAEANEHVPLPIIGARVMPNHVQTGSSTSMRRKRPTSPRRSATAFAGRHHLARPNGQPARRPNLGSRNRWRRSAGHENKCDRKMRNVPIIRMVCPATEVASRTRSASPAPCGNNPPAGCRTSRVDRFPAHPRSTFRGPAASSRHAPG